MLMTNNDDNNSLSPQTSRVVNRSPVFYGWVIMLAGTLGLIMTGPGQTYAVSIFIEHFLEDLAISRSLASTLYAGGTLAGSLALPFIGRQIDRRGSRQMVLIISVLFGLACIYMGFVQNALMLGLGFLAIRLLGQGGLGLVSQNVINQWWVARRGMIMGISGLLLSLLGLGALPGLINWLVNLLGWRPAYMLLGAILLLVMTPVGYFFYRDRPEAYGLQPDGVVSKVADTAVNPLVPLNPAVAEVNWTLAEARRTPMFWIVAASSALIAMLITGLFFHMVSIFADNGLPTDMAAAVFLPIALTTAVVTLLGGVLLDRLPVRLVLAASLILQASALLLAQYLVSPALAMIYGAVIGATAGSFHAVGSVVWAKYYGRQHLGTITGVTATIVIVGSSLGPIPLGVARDTLGSYNQALLILAIFPILLAIAAMFTPKPEKA
jgi:MFS transporter, OFA family, oxalate/formate antiporter